jgi:hypothetical protein
MSMPIFLSFMFVYAIRVHIYWSAFIIFFYPNSFYLVNHIRVMPSRSCGSLFCRFCLSTWLHFLSRALCHLGLLLLNMHIGLFRSFSGNFVCCLSLLDQGHSFDAIIYRHHHHIILFHYLPFAVVHHIISLS